jgi:hypothetical protein
MQPLDHLRAAQGAVKLLAPVHRAPGTWMKTRGRTVKEGKHPLLAMYGALGPRDVRGSAPYPAGFAAPVAGRLAIEEPEPTGSTGAPRTAEEGPVATVAKPAKGEGDGELTPGRGGRVGVNEADRRTGFARADEPRGAKARDRDRREILAAETRHCRKIQRGRGAAKDQVTRPKVGPDRGPDFMHMLCVK